MTQRTFSKGLKRGFVETLNELYDQPESWWCKLVDDKELFLAIRENYVNVYHLGGSLLKLKPEGQGVVGEVHYKYLLRPRLTTSEYVKVIDGVPSLPAACKMFTQNLARVREIKKATKPHASAEKSGVHDIVLSNWNIKACRNPRSRSASVANPSLDPVLPMVVPSMRRTTRSRGSLPARMPRAKTAGCRTTRRPVRKGRVVHRAGNVRGWQTVLNATWAPPRGGALPRETGDWLGRGQSVTASRPGQHRPPAAPATGRVVVRPYTATGVRLNTREYLAAVSRSPRRRAARTSSRRYASSTERYGDHPSGSSSNSTSTSAT